MSDNYQKSFSKKLKSDQEKQRIDQASVVIMKQQKYKEETISGWANQGDTNYDAIMLNNILIRKTTNDGTLPQINYTRNKTEMQHPYHHRYAHLNLTKEKFNHKSNHILKMKREKTEGYENHFQEKSVNKHQNKQFFINQLKLITIQESHKEKNFKNTQNLNLHKQLGDEKDNFRRFVQSSKRQGSISIFSKTMKAHPNKAKSQDGIKKTIEGIQPSKQLQNKLYVKLSTLEMNQKKQFRYECLQKLNENQCQGEELDNLIEKRRRKYEQKVKIGSMDKMNQKLKCTFTKKDIFQKDKQKLSRSDNIEFSDQVIFSNNSKVVSKQVMSNPFLFQKIQILKQPIRNQIPYN